MTFHNLFREEGLIQRRGAALGASGQALSPVIRKIIAAQRTALMPLLSRGKQYKTRFVAETATVRQITLRDGTRIKTWVSPYGLYPSIKSEVFLPEEVLLKSLLPCTAFLESGLWGAIGSSAGIFLSTELQTYFSGSGDTWSWGQDEYAYGEIEDSIYFCGTKTAPTFEDAPITIPVGIYASRAAVTAQQRWLNTVNRSPSKYTGLMRLAAQAFGPSKDITLLQPEGWPLVTPGNYGILRYLNSTTEQAEYWLTYVGSLGCKIVQLSFCAPVDCLLADVYSGTYSTEQMLRTEALILSGAFISPLPLPINLLTKAELLPVYDYQFGALAHGWHWSPQVRGTTSETSTDAIMLAVKKTKESNGWGYSTKRCTLSITFSSTTDPVATLSTGTEGRTGLSRLKHRLYIYSEESGSYFHQENIDGQEELDGDIWGVYTNSGPEWITYTAEHIATPPVTEIPLGAVAGCGSGGSSSNRLTDRTGTWFEGGFTIEGGTVSGGTGMEQWEILDATVSSAGQLTGYMVNNGGSRQCDVITQSSVYDGYTQTDICIPSDISRCAGDVCSGTILDMLLGQAKHTSFGPSFNTSDTQGAALLISADPTIYFSASQKIGTLVDALSRRTNTSNDGVTSVNYISPTTDPPCTVPGGGGVPATGGYHSGTNSGAHGGGIYYSEGDGISNWTQEHIGYAVADANQPGSSMSWGSAGDSAGLSQHLVLFHSGGSQSLLSTANWAENESEDTYYSYLKAICNPYITGNIIGPAAQTSYSGELVHNLNLGAGWNLEGGQDPLLQTASYLRFLGHE